jgi:hypothetical protein
MRIHEILTESKVPVLYHGSYKEFPLGFVLTPQSDGYQHSTSDVRHTEEIIESYRPSDMMSRFDSVFMVDDATDIDNAGGYDDYVYVVEPIGNVERNNLGWYSDVAVYGEYDNDNHEDIEQWSLNYWHGHDAVNGVWEYRARSARIVKVLYTS